MTPPVDRSHLAPVTSRENLIFLLNRASELEHGLACVYLFAGYSLKYESSEGGMTDDQLLMVRGWKRRLAAVAVEEMLHLAQVSNLLTAVGGAPHFKRTNFPMPPEAFPLGIELSLEPFSQETIDRLVCFEMPEAGILPPGKQKEFDELRNAVAAAQTAATPIAPTARPVDQPFAFDYRTVGELYHKILTGFENIPQETLFIGPQQAQSNARYLDFASKLVSVVDAASARRAIEMIVEQGEAPTHDHPDAHFAVFDSIRKGYKSAVAEAKANGTVFAPVRPVISNPMTRDYEDASGGNIITDPHTHDVADLFNLVYDTMLLMLVRFFAHLDEGDEELRMLSRGTLRMMASVLRPLGEALATMPAGPEYPGKTAGPGFGYNRDVALLPHKTSAWVFILERLRELVSKAKAIARAPGCLPQVEEAAAALQSVGDHLVQYIPRQYGVLMDFHSTETTAPPMIVCERDGPYLVTNLAHMTNSKGETLNTRRNLALCRCGGSALKPYCDGTHARIGFSSAKSAQRTEDKLAHYVGNEITIHDNRGTCCHSGNCTDHLPSVFNLKTEPLISPDAADAETIVNIIRQCPSGALSFTRNAKNYEGEQRDPAVFVSKDGPYHVQGGIGLLHEQRNDGASTEHYALCRCGHSKNKPFCDGTHWYVKFSDEDN
jgi:CDGSH-type Zn-finger protein